MIDKSYLQDLLPILKMHGVKSFKTQGLDIQFHVEQFTQNAAVSQWSTPAAGTLESVQALAETLKKQEESMPPDLRADSLMDYEKIINWSSPDQRTFEEEPELPLTGEQPL